MPFKFAGFRSNKKCKYCDKPAKINYNGVKRRHKGYLRTCGSEECLHKQYTDSVVNAKKSYLSKNIEVECEHCGRTFIKKTCTQKWCDECVPDNKSRSIMQRYNLSKKEYLELIDSTNGRCPICNRHPATVVDHDHKNNRVRGFICQHCNTALNLVEDRKSLDRALLYLEGKL